MSQFFLIILFFFQFSRAVCERRRRMVGSKVSWVEGKPLSILFLSFRLPEYLYICLGYFPFNHTKVSSAMFFFTTLLHCNTPPSWAERSSRNTPKSLVWCSYWGELPSYSSSAWRRWSSCQYQSTWATSTTSTLTIITRFVLKSCNVFNCFLVSTMNSNVKHCVSVKLSNANEIIGLLRYMQKIRGIA